jgi:hypothetical protein
MSIGVILCCIEVVADGACQSVSKKPKSEKYQTEQQETHTHTHPSTNLEENQLFIYIKNNNNIF